jgi:fructose-1,6-bisphosphatase
MEKSRVPYNVTGAKLLNKGNCLHPERSEFCVAERTKSKDLWIKHFYWFVWAGNWKSLFKDPSTPPRATRGSAQDEEF